jgi:hypothetical protein
MKGLLYQNQDCQLLFNNNAVQHHQKQQRKYSLNNDKFVSEIKANGKKHMKNDSDTTVRRVNEHFYVVSFDKLQQETKFHSEKSTLIDIHNELLRNKENLLTSQGFIHIKEYIVDGYECRCHEHNDLLNDEEIDNNKHLFNYKLEF